MKKLMIITAILITGFVYTSKSEAKTINHAGFEFGLFYSNLASYGMWIEVDGLVVWRPTIIKKGWAPYRDGRWLWTVDGWYWDSYEPFGYIVFHYGRWYYDDFYGWIWVPDNEWAPAWVEWRYDDAYIGWAPLPPYAVFSMHIGIHYTYDYYVPYHHWHFVRYGHFCNPYVYNYYVAPNYKYRVYNRTKYRNNYGYRDGRIINRGVDVNYVRQRTGQEIRQRDIQRVNDYKEVERYRGKDTEVLRTFVASREQLSKTRTNDVKIEKQNQRSTLDISKVKLGREDVKERKVEVREGRNEKERSSGRENTVEKLKIERKNETRNNERIGNDADVKRKNKTEVKKNENIKIETKKESNIYVPEKKVERREINKPKVNVKPKTEVKRNNEVKRENTNKGNIKSGQAGNENKARVKTEVKKRDNSNRVETRNKVERKSDPDNKNTRRR